jgi:flagellar biogenesis protein FliO
MPGTGAAAGASYGDLLVTSLVVLGAVCVAAFIAVRVFGRLLATGRARGRHLLDVVARVPLEPRRSLYVVEVAGKTLLVGTSEMGLSVLTELDGSEVKSRVQAQQSFGELVRAAWQRRKARAAGRAMRPDGAAEMKPPITSDVDSASSSITPAPSTAVDVPSKTTGEG